MCVNKTAVPHNSSCTINNKMYAVKSQAHFVSFSLVVVK